MRVVNILVIALIIAGSFASVMQSFGDSARTLGSLIGIALMVTPFYLAWRGLGPSSTLSVARHAQAVNIIVGVLIILGLLLLIVYSGDDTTIFAFIPASVVVGIPVLLNIIALGKRKAEIQKAATEVEPKSTLLDVSSHTSTNSTPTPVSTANYFLRHWRGELSLPTSYWVNGAVLTTIATVVLMVGVEQMTRSNYSLRTISIATFACLLFSVIAWLWSVVGVWRSADHHVERGGASVWATVAKFMVVVGFIAMANQLTNNLLPMMKEFALIAIGKDPFGKVDVKIATNGQSVIVTGQFGEGSAAEVQKILDAAPSATSLVLHSNGGRILEAQRLARIVRDRRLNTYVESQCASACTYVFLAGRERAATPSARIGFHQPTFPGLDANTQTAIIHDMMNVYRSAGLPEKFIRRIENTSPEDIWYPTRDELVASNVVTRTSFGGEAAMFGTATHSKSELVLMMGNNPLFQAYERRFPGTIKKAAELGWAVKENGGNDAEVMNAMRRVASDALAGVIQKADDATLESYTRLFLDELTAVKAVSGDACAKLMEGALDITKVLPNGIVEREVKYTIDMLGKPPRPDLTPPDPAMVENAFQAALTNISQQHIQVLADMSAYADQPDIVCDATIALYQSIMTLPARERKYALRGMLQSGR
jgi:ATP-dependent protease ClpP protease subunit